MTIDQAAADRLDRQAAERERQVYLERFGACMRFGFPLADAAEQAALEAARVRRTGA